MTEHAGLVLIVAVSFGPSAAGLLVWAFIAEQRRHTRRSDALLTSLGIETPAQAKARRRAAVRASRASDDLI